MSDKNDSPVNRLSEATNAGLALVMINQPGGHMPEVVNEYREPVRVAQADFNPLQLLSGERQMSQTAMNAKNPDKVEDFGSIQSMNLPGGYGRMRVPADTGYISMDEAPKLYQKQGDPEAKIGVWNRDLKQAHVFDDMKEISSKPPHKLSDDEYFKISDMMMPGPWAGNGRGHEISMSSARVNGKDAIVYDYWMGKDPAKDTPLSQPGADDIRCRVVFVPNEKLGKVDIIWMRAQNKEFNQREKEFDSSLQSVRWK